MPPPRPSSGADLVETLAEGDYDLVHVTAPGPANLAAALLARIAGLPLLGSYHTEFVSYARLRSGDHALEQLASIGLAAFYGAHDRILSPSPAADDSLAGLGVERDLIGRWERGVDSAGFSPALADPDSLPGDLKVLYAGD